MPIRLEARYEGPSRAERVILRASELLLETLDVDDLLDLTQAEVEAVREIARLVRRRIAAVAAERDAACHPAVDVLAAATDDLAEAVSGALSAVAGQTPPARLRRLVDAFSERARAERCPACPHSRSCCFDEPSPCLAEEAPPCLRGSLRLIDLGSRAVSRLYERMVPGAEGAVGVTVLLRPQLDHGRPLVDGRTDFSDGARREAIVAIRVPATLTAEVYHSMLYVAAHEIGVHAVQGVCGLGRPPAPISRHAFAEGFVDEAVSLSLVGLLPESEAFGRAGEAIGERRRSRLTDTYKTVLDWPTEVKRGQRAFGNLVWLGRRAVVSADPDDGPPVGACPQAWAVRVALALNLVPYGEGERDHIVRMLYEQARLRQKLAVDPQGMAALIDALGWLAETPGDAALAGEVLESAVAIVGEPVTP